jgi:phage terminase large subunit GpA-like protein
MDAITDPMIEEITVMKSVRTGGTQAAINNAIGYFIDQDPGPMLVVQPGLKEAKDWSKTHFDVMVRDTECLRNKVHTDKIKDRKNEILYKTFPGGILYIIGANSAAGFRGKTIQRVFLDDVDAYDVSIEGEGDPIALAKNRTITYLYHRRKIVKVSNPTTRGLSRIEREFLLSDQRHYYVPCPFCHFKQVLLFSRQHSQFANLSQGELKFDKDNLSWCYYECENCHKQIPEKEKFNMVLHGEWRATKPEVKGHAGFHLSEMISTFSSWTEMVKDFLTTEKNRERLRVFINQRLGETFVEDKTLEVNEGELMHRCEDYTDVPDGVLVLTAGVDVQVDRLEVIILGWGKEYENWFIDRRVIVGSPEREQTWKELDEFLAIPRKHATGIELPAWSTYGLQCVAIDSGFSTQNVYRYVKSRQNRRFYAIKGDDGFRKPFIIKVGYDKRLRARYAAIGVDSIKVRIYDRLNLQRNAEGPTPGYMHFNRTCDQEFFDQLVAEQRKLVRNRAGFFEWKWMLKEGRRNEVLDCYVYNWAAIELLKPNFDALETKLKEKLEIASVKEGAAEVERVEVERKETQRTDRRRKNWATQW